MDRSRGVSLELPNSYDGIVLRLRQECRKAEAVTLIEVLLLAIKCLCSAFG